jgi:hypothetical protein
VTGFAVEYFGGYGSGFALGASIDLIGVLAMAFLINQRSVPSRTLTEGSAA